MSGWAHAIAALGILASSLSAATISTPTGQFYTDKWNGTNKIDGNRSHFFDGESLDSQGLPTAGCNVGYYVAGGGAGCGNQPAGVDRFAGTNYNGPNRGHDALPWLGNTTTTNDLDFSFQPESPNFVVQLMAEASGAHASNFLGIYTTDGAGNITGSLILFAGSDTPGKTVQFSPGNSNWGFYFVTGAGSYYTERLLGADTTSQHFAVFKDAADTSPGLGFRKLWIGAEESLSSAGFPDYNDMIFTLACVECGNTPGVELGYTPEPDTLLTFGTGASLIAVAGMLGRLRRLRLQRKRAEPPELV